MMTESQLRMEKQNLAERCFRAAEECGYLERIDQTPSVLSRETEVLSALTEAMRYHTDRGEMRMETCLRLMSKILDLQEEAIAERKTQLAKHARQ